MLEKEKSPIPRTMGYPKTPTRSPQDYLKKRSGEKKLEAVKSVPCLCRDLRKCDKCKNGKCITCKSREDSPILLKNSSRNFLTENSLLAVRRPAAIPDPKIIDDRKGNSFFLERSGLVPKYTKKEDYGVKPSYISIIERNLTESRKAFKNFLTAEKQKAMPQKMSEEVKEEIFEGLVKNLKELLRKYLTLPLEIHTPVQRRRKIEIEKRIDVLEKDIDLLMRHKDIFIGKKTKMIG